MAPASDTSGVLGGAVSESTVTRALNELFGAAPLLAGANSDGLRLAAALGGEASLTTTTTTILAPVDQNISESEELKQLDFPPKREDLSTAIPLTLIFALLLLTGCIGNICTAIVIARPKNKYMHTATNYYLFSLAMSDFLFLILGLPQEMYTLWQRYPYAFGESFCIIRGYLSEASTYASILTISAFTVERYVAICHPLWAHTMSQLPRAITSIVIIWCVAAVCAIPPAASLGIVFTVGPTTKRELKESAQCQTRTPLYENMFVVSAIVFFIVPMIIVTVLYILIAIELRRSSRMSSNMSKQHTSNSSSSTNNNGKCAGSTAGGACTSHARRQHCCCQHSSYIKTGAHESPARQQKAHSQDQMAGGVASLLRPRLLLPGEEAEPRPSSAIGTERAPSSTAQNQLVPLSRQLGAFSPNPSACSFERHSPLSYHESLMARAQAKQQQMERQQQRRCVHQSSLSQLQVLQAKAAAESGSACNLRQPIVGPPAQPRPTSALASMLSQQHPLNLSHSQQTIASAVQQQQPQQKRARTSGSGGAASSKKSVIRMLVAVVVSFFICWLPFHAQRLLASYLASKAADVERDAQSDSVKRLFEIFDKLTYISGVMYYLSSTINPLLYQLMSAKFRLAFKETFKCSLFECAIFAPRRQSASSAALAHKNQQHSPSNSIRGATNTTSLSDNGQLNNRSSASCCKCQALREAQAQQLGAGRLPLSRSHQLGLDKPAKPARAVTASGRLLAQARKRLNSSLGSLLNVTSHGAQTNGSFGRCCANCPLRAARAGRSSATGARMPANLRQLRKQIFRNEREMSSSGSTVNTAPLLPAAPPCPVHPNASVQQQAARTVLKFIKRPAPVANGGAVSLTRLSSREDEENAASCGAELARTNSKMGALIRPKLDADDSNTPGDEDNDDEYDENEAEYEPYDELLATNTSESFGCAQSSSSPSSSPEQLAQVSRAGPTNKAADRQHLQKQQQQQQRRRRLSLQQGSNDSNGSSNFSTEQQRRHLPQQGQPPSGIEQSERRRRHLEAKQRQRRKSSTCQTGRQFAPDAQQQQQQQQRASGAGQQAADIADQQAAMLLSSSLSSSCEKYLLLDGKKLSFSTTTSGAVDDCASLTSSTTANSQQHLNLNHMAEESVALTSATDTCEQHLQQNININNNSNTSDSQEIEEDPSTVINVHQSTSDLDECEGANDEDDEDAEAPRESERLLQSCCRAAAAPAKIASVK